MKQFISLTALCIVLTACGSRKEEKPVLSVEQELQMVDSIAQETNAHIEELSKSVDELGHEVDSLLNETK